MDAPRPITRFALPAILVICWTVIVLVFIRFDHDWPVLLVWLGLLVLTLIGGSTSPNLHIFGPARSKARPDRKAVALTFDDGPHPETTRAIAEMLDRAGAKGTFYVIGARAEESPDVLQELVANGHQVGLHGHAHNWKVMLHDPWFLDDLDAGNAAVHSAIGHHPRWFRPPIGLVAHPLFNVRRQWDLQVAGWSVRSLDGRIDDVPTITRRALAAGPGDVVLLHDAPPLENPDRRPPMLDALPAILDGLASKGLEMVTMAELFDEPPWFEPEAVDAQKRQHLSLRGMHLATRFTLAGLLLSACWFGLRAI
ncbi:MAG: polysaccharide deacetylase family protein [Deltaproteobacteria bacterium]|nr:polysaccharide deacetylase family protein [Deltaproteobacteria bacterium]